MKRMRIAALTTALIGLALVFAWAPGRAADARPADRGPKKPETPSMDTLLTTRWYIVQLEQDSLQCYGRGVSATEVHRVLDEARKKLTELARPDTRASARSVAGCMDSWVLCPDGTCRPSC